MPSVNIGSVQKSARSTKQMTGGATFDCKLKDGTSIYSPVFIIAAASLSGNAALWDGRYYSIDDIIWVHNNLAEVHCTIDLLATYKSDILDTSQYVAYAASITRDKNKIDPRTAYKSSYTIQTAEFSLPFVSLAGYYYLTVIGKSGAVMYQCSLAQLQALISVVSNTCGAMSTDRYDDISGATDVLSMLKVMGEMAADAGIYGNRYEVAVQCIRSCVWSPFNANTIGLETIYLGDLSTGISAQVVSMMPIKSTGQTINIPWRYNDFRRMQAEHITVVLPFVGTVQVPTEQINGATYIGVEYSYTPGDGTICYMLLTGETVLGTYTANCSLSYPIGINQHASAGAMMGAAVDAVKSTVSGGITGFAQGVYNMIDRAYSTTPSMIGGGGGGTMAGLPLNVAVIVQSLDTVEDPTSTAFIRCFGYPLFATVVITDMTGYLQTVNAHVPISAPIEYAAQIEAMMDGGIYIE